MRQQIYITEKDADIVPHLKKQPNISQYVIKLIRKDIQNKNKNLEQQVISIIKKYFKQNTIQNSNSQINGNANKNIKQSIQNVLNL